MKNFKTQLLWHLSCYWCCKTRLSWCSITFLTELWRSSIVCQVKLMFSITPIRKFVYMVLHNSMKLWADGSVEVIWCLEKLLFFYLSRGLMLLMDVSVVQSACSSLCPEICVFTSLPSSVTFAFFVRRGNIPSYDVGEPCPGEHKGCSRSELLRHPSQERIKHRAPCTAGVPLLWASQIWYWRCPLLTGPNIAMLAILVLLEVTGVLYRKSQNSDFGLS